MNKDNIFLLVERDVLRPCFIVASSLVLFACASTVQVNSEKANAPEPVTVSPPILEENQPSISPAPDVATASRLVLAARFGQESTVRYLLSSGTGVDVRDAAGNTALIAAAANGQADIVRFLLAQGADVHAINNEKNTALMGAATKGKGMLVRVLMEAEASIDAKNNEGETALFLAVQYAHLDTAEVLLNHGANPNTHNARRVNDADSAYTPLMYAVTGGLTHGQADWLAMVVLLLDNGADPDLADRQGETALMLANERGDKRIAEMLIQGGAKDDISYMTLNKEEALLKAIRLGDEKKVAALLQAGAKSNYMNENGVTPLLAAAYEGQLDIVKQLIAKKASINFVTSGLRPFALAKSHAPMRDRALMAAASRGDTPLIIAGRQGHEATFAYLIDKEAQIDLPNRHGEVPLFVVAKKGHLALTALLLKRGAIVDAIEQDNRSTRKALAQTSRGRNSVLIAAVRAKQFAVAKQLLDAGADVNYRGRQGKTALFLAVDTLQSNLVQLLLDHNAVISLGSSAGIKPLMLAAMQGDLVLVNLLIIQGSEINALDTPDLGYSAKGFGMTALMYAARAGHAEVITALLQAGAAINIHNAKGKTALHEAMDNGHNVVADQLIVAGASSEVVLSGI